MLAALALGVVLAHFTRFGANVYAIGGDRNSARLMGAPIRRTMVQVYALGGFTARWPASPMHSIPAPAIGSPRSALSSTPSPRSCSAGRC
jgi:hypothetical protein